MDKARLVAEALGLFLKYGIKSITMDDVSKELGISKKTLYQIVVDKEDLVNKATKYYTEKDRHTILNIVNSYSNAVEQLVQICNYSCNVLREMNPSVIYDLKKYHPDSWNVYLTYKNSFIYEVIFHNIKNGIEKGFYRADLNIDIICRFYVGQIETIINPDIFPTHQYKFENTCKEFLIYHIHGISTAEGIEQLTNYLTAQQNLNT